MSLSSSWYQKVRIKLESSGIFARIEVIGAKVRSSVRNCMWISTMIRQPAAIPTP
jgi:hypothetical protein